MDFPAPSFHSGFPVAGIHIRHQAFLWALIKLIFPHHYHTVSVNLYEYTLTAITGTLAIKLFNILFFWVLELTPSLIFFFKSWNAYDQEKCIYTSLYQPKTYCLRNRCSFRSGPSDRLFTLMHSWSSTVAAGFCDSWTLTLWLVYLRIEFSSLRM